MLTPSLSLSPSLTFVWRLIPLSPSLTLCIFLIIVKVRITDFVLCVSHKLPRVVFNKNLDLRELV